MSPTRLQRNFTLGLLTEWRNLSLPFENVPVVLAISGGADSCALALACGELSKRGKLDCRFLIAHFDHGLRGEKSEADSRFVEGLAADLGFEFTLGKAPADTFRSKTNLEEKARDARYLFLLNAAAEYGSASVLVAHTRNDQAETLLLNLIRGSGLSGLAGMESVRVLSSKGTTAASAGPGPEADVNLVRPLMSWATRDDTVAYVADRGVTPRIDEMNEDSAFDRVKVRKELIPVLKRFNPRIIETLARTADTLRMDLDLLEKEQITLEGLRNQESLPVTLLNELPDGLALRSIKSWLEVRRGSLRSIGKVHLNAILDLAKSKKSGRVAELPGSGRAVKRKGRIWYE